MSELLRILLVEDNSEEWSLALSALSQSGQMSQTAVVKDKGEALDFLHRRGAFRCRAEGLPSVVVLGPGLSWRKTFSLLSYIRGNGALRRIPVVLVKVAIDSVYLREAYLHGANSVVRWSGDPRLDSQRYAAIGIFWTNTNEPPPGCLAKVSLP
jgi:CheY-like chemotaxis protein